ncbi:MAG: SAM-dependent methyltransferase [Erysipelothrix sp.]|nr:SAM-dependent methyltransferase [Erysipelothrix sp.]
MLSKRLSVIAALVNKNSIVADIGSDHGLLPCFLIKNNIAIKAYAMDNKQGPLKSAIENIELYALKAKVIPVLSDGLNKLSTDVTSIVIAGMGFITIKTILESNIDLLENIDQVIIQSNTDVNMLRKWIYDKQYLLKNEKIVKDNNKYYFIFDIDPKTKNIYNDNNFLISSILVENKDELYLEYLSVELKKLKKINLLRKDESLLRQINIIENTLAGKLNL